MPVQAQPPAYPRNHRLQYFSLGDLRHVRQQILALLIRTFTRPTPSGMGAVYGRPRHKHLRFLFWYFFPVLPLWLLQFLLFPLSWTSGDAGTSHEVSFANTWTIAVLNGFSRYPPPRRHWSKVAPQHTGDVSSLPGRMSPPLLLASLSRVLPKLLQDRERTSLKRKVRVSLAVPQLKKLDGGRAIWIVRESSALVRLKKLDEVVPSGRSESHTRTRQAEKYGSRPCHLDPVGHPPNDSQLTTPGLVGTGLGTDVVRRHTQRRWNTWLRTSRRSQTPLASEPRGNGNGGTGVVGTAGSDIFPSDRSSLDAFSSGSVSCSPFCVILNGSGRRLFTVRSVTELDVVAPPPILPVRGCLECVRKLMRVDRYIGRGKVAVFGRSEALAEVVA